MRVLMPLMSRPIHAGIQGDNLVLWVEISKNSPELGTTQREVIVVFTGLEFEGDGLTYLNSFTGSNGLVFHAYVDINPR